MLIAESLDVAAGLLKLLLVIKHICHSSHGVGITAPTGVESLKCCKKL
ncbi:hypothetical protein [Anabaena sp. CCY 0017]